MHVPCYPMLDAGQSSLVLMTARPTTRTGPSLSWQQNGLLSHQAVGNPVTGLRSPKGVNGQSLVLPVSWRMTKGMDEVILLLGWAGSRRRRGLTKRQQPQLCTITAVPPCQPSKWTPTKGAVQVCWFYPCVRDSGKPAVSLLLAYSPLGKQDLHPCVRSSEAVVRPVAG